MTVNMEQILGEKIHALPYPAQTRVLQFVETLEKEVDSANDKETDEAKQQARHARLMSLVGIGQSKSGNVSERVDEILAEGINKREGWSLP